MNAPHERLTFEPVLMLPGGAFLRHNRWVDHCYTLSPNGQERCFRARGHEGRHALIGHSGLVWAVWGPDVHAERRARGRESRLIEASNARQDAFYRRHDRTVAATS